jgi:thymidylate kinase
MIVEFVGSTGAGKTTIASEVQRRLAQSAQVVSAYDLASALAGLGRYDYPTLRNLTQDLVGLPFFFRAMVRHRSFLAFALKTTMGQSQAKFLIPNYVRSIARKLGIYEMSKRHGRELIVLVDEGTVSSAHLLFVFTRSLYRKEEVEQFAALVPLPDLVVFLKAPVEVLVQRAHQRGDAPREIKSRNSEEIEDCISRATHVYDQLSRAPRLRERVLVASNPASTGAELGQVADGITKAILKIAPAVRQTRSLPAGQIGPTAAIGEKGAR